MGIKGGALIVVGASFLPTRLGMVTMMFLNTGHYVVFEKEDKRGDKYPATVREKLNS